MIINIAEFVKWWFFNKIKWNFCVLSDFQISCDNFFSLDTLEPVWSILNYSRKFELVFVVLDTLNFDNIYRLYKYEISNICIINLNSWYSWIWKKWIYPDMDDIYIKENISVLEPYDLNSFDVCVSEFAKKPKLTHIRVPDRDFERNILKETKCLDFNSFVNFNQFWISWYSATILAYWAVLPELIWALNLLNSEQISCDLFRSWNYKKEFDSEIVESFLSHDLIFIVWDFCPLSFKDFLFSRFYDAELEKREIEFITPHLTEIFVKEYLQEKTGMWSKDIYRRIKSKLIDFET